MPLIQISALPARTLFPGVSGRYAYGERTTAGKVLLAAGTSDRYVTGPPLGLVFRAVAPGIDDPGADRRAFSAWLILRFWVRGSRTALRVVFLPRSR